MNNEVSKNIKCICIRNGVEVWADEDFVERLSAKLEGLSGHAFIRFEGRLLNTADITGIFTAQDMEEVTRRKNGQWKCNHNNWHYRKEECDCWQDRHKNWSGLAPGQKPS